MQYFYQDLSCAYLAHHELKAFQLLPISLSLLFLYYYSYQNPCTSCIIKDQVNTPDVCRVHKVCASMQRCGLKREDRDQPTSKNFVSFKTLHGWNYRLRQKRKERKDYAFRRELNEKPR